MPGCLVFSLILSIGLTILVNLIIRVSWTPSYAPGLLTHVPSIGRTGRVGIDLLAA